MAPLNTPRTKRPVRTVFGGVVEAFWAVTAILASAALMHAVVAELYTTGADHATAAFRSNKQHLASWAFLGIFLGPSPEFVVFVE